MLADAGEKIAQVGLGLYAVETCRTNERVEDRGPLAAGVGAQEQPILSAELQGPNGILSGVVRKLQPAVADVARERDDSRTGTS